MWNLEDEKIKQNQIPIPESNYKNDIFLNLEKER